MRMMQMLHMKVVLFDALAFSRNVSGHDEKTLLKRERTEMQELNANTQKMTTEHAK